jgi:hypothetical protein
MPVKQIIHVPPMKKLVHTRFAGLVDRIFKIVHDKIVEQGIVEASMLLPPFS